jgi:hypothetical protein
MPVPKYSSEEIAARGEAIYDRDIRSKVEGTHDGKFLVLDIETGEYEIDDKDITASLRALAKRPEAVLYGLRIGRRTAYRLGGFYRDRRP